MLRTVYKLQLISRKTGDVVEEYTRMSEKAFDRLWCLALKNVNPLQYKMKEVHETIEYARKSHREASL